MPRTYRRHEPEKTVLYNVVREHLETFLDEGRGPEGEGYPGFVEHEFRRVLACGLLSRGFARLRCAQCGYERLAPLSCCLQLETMRSSRPDLLCLRDPPRHSLQIVFCRKARR